MAQSLVCNDCGLQLKSVKEATDHNEATGHANFAESEEKVRALEMTPIKPCKISILGSLVRIGSHLCCTAIHFASCYLDFLHPNRCIRCVAIDAKADVRHACTWMRASGNNMYHCMAVCYRSSTWCARNVANPAETRRSRICTPSTAAMPNT